MTQSVGFFSFSYLSQIRRASLECSVRGIDPPSLSARASWSKSRFNKVVQFIQIDSGEQRAQNPPLRAATVRGVVAPLLQVSSFEEPFDEPKQSAIVNVLAQD